MEEYLQALTSRSERAPQRRITLTQTPSRSQPSTQGYFHTKRPGGPDFTSSLEAKFGQGPAKPTKKEENLGKFCHHKTQTLGGNPILGSYLNSEDKIWGICHIYSGGKISAPTRISEADFGAKPPYLPMRKHPRGHQAPKSSHATH